MKVRALFVGAGLSVVILATGCASFHARSAPAYRKTPHTYPALRYTWDSQGLYDRYEPEYMSRPSPFTGVGGVGQRTLGGSIIVWLGYSGCFLVYASVVETPLSLVTDTLLYPYDRLRMHDLGAAIRKTTEAYSAETDIE